MFEQVGEDVVAQSFLQADVAFGNAAMHHGAHEVVIDHFVNAVVFGARAFERDIQIDIDDDALRCMLFEIVHTNADLHRETSQKQATAVEQEFVVHGRCLMV